MEENKLTTTAGSIPTYGMNEHVSDPILTIKSEQHSFKRLGGRVNIGPKSLAIVHKPGYQITCHQYSVEVTIGIGNNHTAFLVMDFAAFEALKKGDLVHITTSKEFKKNIL